MSSASVAPAADPSDPAPGFLRRHGHAVAAVVVAVLTVFLAVISFPPYDMPEFAYAMLVPGAFWAYTRPSFRLYAAVMLAAQAVAWTLLLGWLHHVTWVGLLLLGPFIGVWVGTWYLAAWWTLPRMIGQPTPNRLLALLGLAGAWVLIEWTRTWFLGGFPWLPLAASQWTMVSMLQVAAYTGAGGVSFVIVALNLGFAAYAHRLFREGVTGLNKRSQEFFLALFLVLACFSVHVQEAFNRVHFNVPLGRVAFVQPYIPQQVKWDPAQADAVRTTLRDLTLQAGVTRPDLILWPEAATPWALRGDPGMQAFVQSVVQRAGVPLVAGSIAIEESGTPRERWYNGAFLVTPDTGLQPGYYAKRQLVPFGEFVPLRAVLGWISKFVPIGDDFARGEGPAPLEAPVRGGTLSLGPLICYEDIYPALARATARADVAAMAVLTNNGWFGEGGAAQQHAAHSVLRAVETRRPVLRCGNGGWSGWIDEFGSIRAVVTNEAGSIYFRGTKTVTVTRDQRWIGRDSFYAAHGEWFLLVCAGLVMVGGGLLHLGRSGRVGPSA